MAKIRSVILRLQEADCQWLEKTYGDEWTRRMEQHIHSEVALRMQDGREVLKEKPPWDY
jgi:hypothetical protein